jgi:hypothetical protein
VRIAYADPPYPGMSHFYREHPDYAGEVDHAELVDRLERDYDGWVLHTAATTLHHVLALCPADVRVCSWVKTFASWKAGVHVVFAWEPVLIRMARVHKRDPDNEIPSITDWIACPITLKRGLTGAKPEPVVHWALRICGARSSDDFHDLYPGSGAVERAWATYRDQGELLAGPKPYQPTLEEVAP